MISGVSPEGVATTPEDSMLVSDSSREGTRRLGVRPTPLDMADLELEKALLSAACPF